MNILNMLRSNGEFEVNRVVGASGAAAYILCANGFEAWQVLHLGHEFDVTAYCLAFPGGLAVAVGAIAGAVSLKDRNVATANVVRETGAMPTTQPTGPQQVQVVNQPENPVPVEATQ